MSHDVRAIANLVIDLAEEKEVAVSNLSINKIVYFLHEAFLLKYKKPLVTAKIEAWDHGPVFRELYHQFKVFGKEKITNKATKLDPVTGGRVTPLLDLSSSERWFLRGVCIRLLEMPPGRLVAISHELDGPWHRARFGNGGYNPGVQITDELILDSNQ